MCPAGLRALGQGAPGLQRLHIDGLPLITAAGVAALQACACLHTLSAADCTWSAQRAALELGYARLGARHATISCVPVSRPASTAQQRAVPWAAGDHAAGFGGEMGCSAPLMPCWHGGTSQQQGGGLGAGVVGARSGAGACDTLGPGPSAWWMARE